MQRQPHLWLSLIATAAAAWITTGCATAPLSADQGNAQVDSPRVAFELLRNAVKFDNPLLFHYLIASDVRTFTADEVRRGWDEVKAQRVPFDPDQVEVLAVEFLEDSPIPPYPAARLIVTYPSPNADDPPGTWYTEHILFILELDSDNFLDLFPMWRIYYPHLPFHDGRLRSEARPSAELISEWRRRPNP